MRDLKAARLAAMKEHSIDTKALLDGDAEEYRKDREFINPLMMRYNKIWLHAAMRRVVVNHNLHAPFVKFRDNVAHEYGTILETNQVKLYWGKSLGSVEL